MHDLPSRIHQPCDSLVVTRYSSDGHELPVSTADLLPPLRSHSLNLPVHIQRTDLLPFQSSSQAWRQKRTVPQTHVAQSLQEVAVHR